MCGTSLFALNSKHLHALQTETHTEGLRPVYDSTSDSYLPLYFVHTVIYLACWANLDRKQQPKTKQ